MKIKACCWESDFTWSDPIHLYSSILLLCNCRQLAVFTSLRDSPILNIVFNVTTSHLVAGTEKGCFAWKLDDRFFTSHQPMKHRYVRLTCCLQCLLITLLWISWKSLAGVEFYNCHNYQVTRTTNITSL